MSLNSSTLHLSNLHSNAHHHPCSMTTSHHTNLLTINLNPRRNHLLHHIPSSAIVEYTTVLDSCTDSPTSAKIKCIQVQTFPSSSFSTKRRSLKPAHCSPPQQIQQEEDVGTMCDCEPCSGRGWLVCTFCNGQKTNVKSENNRIYRRCPSCRAIGYVLCSKCKVFKCVTFPDYSDAEQ